MRNLSFELCGRCKQVTNQSTVSVTVGHTLVALICQECVAPVEEIIKAELNQVSIPEALKPYLKLPA